MRAALLALYWGVIFLLPAMCVCPCRWSVGDATSALASLRLLSCVFQSRVFVPPTFHSCSLLAAGLFRVEHQSPFMSLGNAEQ